MAIIVLYAIIGCVLTGVVALKPRMFWPILIMVTVGTAGLMVRGYTFIDEYFIGCVLFGGFLAISVGAIHFRRGQEKVWDQFHRWIFFLMVTYMIVQSWRGLLLLESWQKSRWIVYYGMLGVISFIVSKNDFSIPNVRKISLIISGSALLYLILYLAHGLFSELVRGISRWDLQTVEWSSTAYALFPLAIAMPAVIFLLRDRSQIYRWVGWATLIAAISAAFYYHSRISWLVIFSFLFVSLFKTGARRVVVFLLCFLLIFGLFFWISDRAKLIERTSDFSKDLYGIVENLWVPRVRAPDSDYYMHDIDRYMFVRVAFVAKNESWKNFLFGYGFRTHGRVISPHLKRLYTQYNLPHLAEKVRDDESTEAFTALLVDTGWVGMLLLAMNFLFVARKILVQKKNPNRIILLLSLIFTLLWLPVINMLDIMLFYVLIMPSGLLVQLSQYRMTEQSLVEKNRQNINPKTIY